MSLKIFWAQQKLGGTKKFGEHFPRRPPGGYGPAVNICFLKQVTCEKEQQKGRPNVNVCAAEENLEEEL